MKSDSGSTVKTRKYRLSRLLGKRDVRLDVMEESDIKYLWAAYNKGMWDGVIEFGLSKDEFVDVVYQGLALSDAIFLISGKNSVGNIGVLTIKPIFFGQKLYHRPHIDFFPWATDRNKLEACAESIVDLRKQYSLLIDCDKETNIKFVTHVAKYGILRRVGKLDQIDGEVYLFESMGIK